MKENEDGTVTLTKAEYVSLVKSECTLEALEAVGVDNWSGWGEQCEIRDEMIEARLGKEYVRR